MSGPIVFVSHFEVKEGALEGLRQLIGELVPRLEADKPGTVGYLIYLDSNGMQATFVHVFEGAASMDRHFQGAQERSARAYEFMRPIGWEIYGAASAPALDGMRREAAAAGVPLSVMDQYGGGFLRSGGT